MKITIGTISDSAEKIKIFINSFSRLYEKYGHLYSLEYRIVILENGINLGLAKDRRIDIISQETYKSISENRTKIQKYIYENSVNEDIIWIIDDDLLFEYKDKVPDYFMYIQKLSLLKIDAVFGYVSETPPLPFFSTIGVQLTDLYTNLNHILNQNPNEYFNVNTENNKKIINNNRDYYYDLSKEKSTLNCSFFWEPKNTNITNHEAGFSILKESLKLRNGQTVFRKIEYCENDFGKIENDSILRGGNTIIFNRELLRVPNYTPNECEYNRRSDFNWAILNRELNQAVLKNVVLPLKHSREVFPKRCLKKYKADLVGLLFYRLFEQIITGQDASNIIESFKDLKEELFERIKVIQKHCLDMIIKNKNLLNSINQWTKNLADYHDVISLNNTLLDEFELLLINESSLLEENLDSIEFTHDIIRSIKKDITIIKEGLQC